MILNTDLRAIMNLVGHVFSSWKDFLHSICPIYYSELKLDMGLQNVVTESVSPDFAALKKMCLSFCPSSDSSNIIFFSLHRICRTALVPPGLSHIGKQINYKGLWLWLNTEKYDVGKVVSKWTMFIFEDIVLCNF